MKAPATLLVSLCALCLGACASAPPEKTTLAQATTEADGKICVREYHTGTKFPTTVCRTQQQIDDEKKSADAVKEAIRRNPTLPGATGPAGL